MSKINAYSMHGKNYSAKKLIIGKEVFISSSAKIDLMGNVFIGDYTEIGDDVIIYTHKHFWNHSRHLRKDIQKIKCIDLNIGKDVYIGTRSIIIGINSIGDGAVIGAGSVITKDIPPYEVWAGAPARRINERK